MNENDPRRGIGGRSYGDRGMSGMSHGHGEHGFNGGGVPHHRDFRQGRGALGHGLTGRGGRGGGHGRDRGGMGQSHGVVGNRGRGNPRGTPQGVSGPGSTSQGGNPFVPGVLPIGPLGGNSGRTGY